MAEEGRSAGHIKLNNGRKIKIRKTHHLHGELSCFFRGVLEIEAVGGRGVGRSVCNSKRRAVAEVGKSARQFKLNN